MSLKIIKAGLQDTIQDMGRYGYQHLGINPGGAMDKFSASLANMLVGNDRKEAVLEIHFPASQFLFTEPALIALCGADMGAVANEKEIPMRQPVFVNKNTSLRFQKLSEGARSYLAIHKGFDLSAWLGSYSTHLKLMAGGYKGRVLQKSDELGFIPLPASSRLEENDLKILPWRAGIEWGDAAMKDIYILPGREWVQMTDHSKQQFSNGTFSIANQADRMGYLLTGERVNSNQDQELVSSGVSFGTIQLLPNGSLMLLMADHQTTGGYPRIGHVITAHHSRLAQLKPGDNIRFCQTDPATAENLFIKQQQHLLQLQNACTFSLQDWLHAYY